MSVIVIKITCSRTIMFAENAPAFEKNVATSTNWKMESQLAKLGVLRYDKDSNCFSIHVICNENYIFDVGNWAC